MGKKGSKVWGCSRAVLPEVIDLTESVSPPASASTTKSSPVGGEVAAPAAVPSPSSQIRPPKEGGRGGGSARGKRNRDETGDLGSKVIAASAAGVTAPQPVPQASSLCRNPELRDPLTIAISFMTRPGGSAAAVNSPCSAGSRRCIWKVRCQSPTSAN